ncbi:SWI/SNF-related matrix-associated actin-dependent regulator of chromatin subfamily A containing DEAD/H box 1A-like [Aplochiton taeniatus]
MSVFNLERFRFDKNKPATLNQEKNGSISPESEKENKPARVTTVRCGPVKSHAPGEAYSNDDVQPTSDQKSVQITKKTKESVRGPCEKEGNECKGEEDNHAKELEERVGQLLDVFPQRTRDEAYEVINSTSTLEGAVAACLMKYGDKKDLSRKRKQEWSSSSHDSDVNHPNKKRRPSVSDDENGPGWEKQDAMVRRLHRKFPNQDKEELRAVLQEHEWHFTNALEVLRMFSCSDDSSLNSTDDNEIEPSKAKSLDNPRKDPKNSQHCKDNRLNKEDIKDHKDTKDSESTCIEGQKDISVSEGFSEWVCKSSEPSSSCSSLGQKSIATSTTKKCSSSFFNVSYKRDKFDNGTSAAVKGTANPKKEAGASDNDASSSDGESAHEDNVSSEFTDSEDELDSGEEEENNSTLKTQILQFFEVASLDELTLISGCSARKAQKIVDLRPFSSWQILKDGFNKQSGLSMDLLLGCRVVLKERTVVEGLMSKCETITNKIVKDVTQVVEKGPGALQQPSLLNPQYTLKSYQIIGLKWLILLHQHKLSGILADEMGLGKTIQAIAFLAQLYQDGIDGPHLITVPASTLDNWVRELKLWCPSLKVLVYCGSVEDRRYLKHDILSGEVDFNVIVSTYNLAIGNDSDRSLFRKLRLKYAVFDEGHMLKNMNSVRYRHLMAINAEHRLLLTGTPLQNNLLELMSLLNFIMPSMFSSSTTQIAKMFSMKSCEEQSQFERNRITHAKLIMKPFILRRVKSEVLKHLPAKDEKVEFCSMSEKQEVLYQSLFKRLRKSTNGEKRELCNVAMQLRKMANHPLLHRQYYTTDRLRAMSKHMLKEPSHYDADPALIQEDMEVMSDFELHRLCQQYTSLSSYQLDTHLLLDSGKFHLLTKLLATLKTKGDRVVLFSQFTMMLDIVEILLRHLKHRYVRLDGSTPIADRIVLIDEFNNDPNIFVFLLSTRAGGLGINLTSANVVILHDMDYNPYNDKQAEDRCHRLGQTKTVQVIKLVSKDSVEDCMLQLRERKLRLEQDMTAAEQGDEGALPDDMASLLKASLGL